MTEITQTTQTTPETCVCEICGCTIHVRDWDSDINDAHTQHILVRHPEEQ